MQRVFYRILVFCLLCPAVLPTSVRAADPERLSVAYCLDCVPFHFQDENGDPAGMIIDYWRLWSEKTGIKVQFVAAPWDQTLKMVGAGAADAHAGLFFNDERDKFLDYGTALRKTATHVFFHRSIPTTTRFKELAAYRIGVLGGDYVEGFLKERVPGGHIVGYPDYESIVEAIKAGELRVFAVDTPTGLYHLKKAGLLTEFTYVADGPLYRNDWFTAATEGDAETIALINRGMALITEAESREIARQWVGTRRSKTDDALIIAMSRGYPPFTFINAQGEPAGLLVDLWRKWSEKTGRKIRFRPSSWVGTLEGLKSGEADLHAGLSYSADRAKRIRFSRQIYETFSKVYHLIGTEVPARFGDYGTMVLGVSAGSYQAEQIRKLFPGGPGAPLPDHQGHGRRADQFRDRRLHRGKPGHGRGAARHGAAGQHRVAPRAPVRQHDPRRHAVGQGSARRGGERRARPIDPRGTGGHRGPVDRRCGSAVFRPQHDRHRYRFDAPGAAMAQRPPGDPPGRRPGLAALRVPQPAGRPGRPERRVRHPGSGYPRHLFPAAGVRSLGRDGRKGPVAGARHPCGDRPDPGAPRLHGVQQALPAMAERRRGAPGRADDRGYRRFDGAQGRRGQGLCHRGDPAPRAPRSATGAATGCRHRSGRVVARGDRRLHRFSRGDRPLQGGTKARYRRHRRRDPLSLRDQFRRAQGLAGIGDHPRQGPGRHPAERTQGAVPGRQPGRRADDHQDGGDPAGSADRPRGGGHRRRHPGGRGRRDRPDHDGPNPEAAVFPQPARQEHPVHRRRVRADRRLDAVGVGLRRRPHLDPVGPLHRRAPRHVAQGKGPRRHPAGTGAVRADGGIRIVDPLGEGSRRHVAGRPRPRRASTVSRQLQGRDDLPRPEELGAFLLFGQKLGRGHPQPGRDPVAGRSGRRLVLLDHGKPGTI